MMRGDARLKNLTHISLEARARAFFVGLAQAAIAHDIGDQDGDKPTVHALPRVGTTQLTSQHYAEPLANARVPQIDLKKWPSWQNDTSDAYLPGSPRSGRHDLRLLKGGFGVKGGPFSGC